MRIINMIIFFTVFFLLYGLLNYYIFRHGWHAIPAQSVLRKWYFFIFLFIALSFITGRILENIWMSIPSDVLIWIGSFWFAYILYLFLAVVVIDLVRLINHFIPFYPSIITRNYQQTKQILALAVIIITSGAVLIGYINAQHIRIKKLILPIEKHCSQTKMIRIAAASDIHLGSIIGRKRFCKMVGLINEQKPDIVLFPGDLIDEDIAPVIKKNLGDAIERIQSRWGIYACTGNHEYIGGAEEACRYMKQHGILLLRDKTVKINDMFYLIGREDRSIKSFEGKNRKSLAELMAEVDKSLPIILMDHQPFQLHEAEEAGVDLQLSGHTHHGQLWPLNLITSLLYELSWGYKQKGKTHFYVSSGAGTWGPPVRLGSSPEIVVIDLQLP
jgi:predicted MPP superfamily phosphohydrolase